MPRDSLGRRAFLGRAAVGAGLSQLGSASARAEQPTTTVDDTMPDSSVADLARAVQGVIASKRLGTPVFVRLTVAGAAHDGAIINHVAGLLDLAAGWLGQDLARLHAVGNLEQRQLSVTAAGTQGGTALISFTGDKPHGDGLDLLLIGSHGAAYRDAGTGQLWDAFASSSPKANPAIAKAIQQSLKSGKPVLLKRDQ